MKAILAMLGLKDTVEVGTDEADSKASSFILTGDLLQMSAQKKLLEQYLQDGMRIEVEGGIPVLHGTESQIRDAVSQIWHQRADGWWSYKQYFVSLWEVCTEREFGNALTAASED